MIDSKSEPRFVLKSGAKVWKEEYICRPIDGADEISLVLERLTAEPIQNKDEFLFKIHWSSLKWIWDVSKAKGLGICYFNRYLSAGPFAWDVNGRITRKAHFENRERQWETAYVSITAFSHESPRETAVRLVNQAKNLEGGFGGRYSTFEFKKFSDLTSEEEEIIQPLLD